MRKEYISGLPITFIDVSLILVSFSDLYHYKFLAPSFGVKPRSRIFKLGFRSLEFTILFPRKWIVTYWIGVYTASFALSCRREYLSGLCSVQIA